MVNQQRSSLAAGAKVPPLPPREPSPTTYLGFPAREELWGWSPLECKWGVPDGISMAFRLVLRVEIRPGLWVMAKELARTTPTWRVGP